MGEIIFKNISKSFGDVKVIENLNLTIRDGEFTVLVGSSGCGKTTLLRMIAGIGSATSGELFIDGEEISDVPPGKRGIAMVFQNYAIYPTMTVRGNIEYGLKNARVPKAERDRLIAEVTQTVGLAPYLNRKPGELSGGQRQRVALARAMVKKPKIFLLDEPLSNLDAKLRVAMRTELIELHHRLKTTFVYVTHDQTEAMSMADTIILMESGKIRQKGTPEEIYENPDNIFTARFIGAPPMNVYSMRGREESVGFRPESLVLTRESSHMLYQRRAKILTREMLGSEIHYKFLLKQGDQDITIMGKSSQKEFDVDETVYINVAEENLYFFDGQENRIRDEPALKECFAMVMEGL